MVKVSLLQFTVFSHVNRDAVLLGHLASHVGCSPQRSSDTFRKLL
jgi:hypothetical protein